MPHVIERAATGRAKCRGCGESIAKDGLRFGERLPNPFDEGGGEMTHWFHLACAAYRRPEALAPTLTDYSAEVPDREILAREAALGLAHRRLPRVGTASQAPSGRATCRACRTIIEKGAWRIALVYYEDGRFTPSGFIHAGCTAAYIETTDVLPRLRHFSRSLSPEDLSAIRDAIHDGARQASARA